MFLFLMGKRYIVQWLIKAMLEKKMILFPQERYFVPTTYYLVPITYYIIPSRYYFVPTRKIFCSLNILFCSHNISSLNHIGGVMVSVHASNAVDRGFEPQSGQTKHFKIGIWCFSAKQSALRKKSKDWLARNQNNVSEWSDMSTRGLLFL